MDCPGFCVVVSLKPSVREPIFEEKPTRIPNVLKIGVGTRGTQ